MAKNKKVYDVCNKRVIDKLGKDIATLSKEIVAKSMLERKKIRETQKTLVDGQEIHLHSH